MATIGIIGAGNVGSQVARRAIAIGYDVVIANSGDPEKLAGLVGELGARASAGTVDQAARAGDLVFVAIPVSAYRNLPVEPFAGRIVVDTGNYYPAWNGHIPELDDESTTTAELLQAHLQGGHVVKAFSNLGAADITADALPPGHPDRRALVVAGNYDEAKGQVAGLIDAFGFDVVDAGPLSEGWRYQRDLPASGVRRDAEDMRAALAAARRYRDR